MLSTVDTVIIVVYLAAMIAVGLATRGRQQDVDDYFIAEGQLGGWFGSILVGFSIAATLFSGISFIFYPSVMYSGGIVLLVGVVTICMPAAYLVLRWFLPRYLAQGITHPYETIERKFGPATRTTASVMYALMRVGWMAALIYAPTLAIMAAGHLSPAWFWPCVLATGIVSTLYTVFGGIRGVIVTDAIQFVVIFGGILATLAYIGIYLPFSLTEAVETLRQTNRLNLAPASLDPTAGLTIWTVAIGGTVANLANYVGDQMSLQRYLGTGDTKVALRTFAINVYGVIGVLIPLSTIGLALFVYYRAYPDPTLPTNIDEIFPHFIATKLPVGISGLILAAILAATMSSMTSGINALSATVTLDLMPRMYRPLSPKEQLRFAKVFSAVIGIVCTLLAGVVHRLGTLFDLTQILLGSFAGPLLVVVMLSVVQRPISSLAMIAGLVAGCIAGWAVALSPVAPLWTAPVAAASTLVLALLISALQGTTVKASSQA